jgi:hypothetical protein
MQRADADLLLVAPTYVFASPVLGGQLTMSMAIFGRNRASVDATLTGALGPIGFTVGGGRGDSVTGFGDLYPQLNLRWNQGVNNFMTYVTGDIPVGAYDRTPGKYGHWSWGDRRRRRYTISIHRPGMNSPPCLA